MRNERLYPYHATEKPQKEWLFDWITLPNTEF